MAKDSYSFHRAEKSITREIYQTQIQFLKFQICRFALLVIPPVSALSQ